MAAVIFGAYWAGGRIAREQCRAEYAAIAAKSVMASINRYNEMKRKIDAEIFNTNSNVVRQRLRDKYTIAD